MIASDETKYKKGQTINLRYGGMGVVIDVYIPPNFDEPKYTIEFADGQIFTYQESELAPYTEREKNGAKHETVKPETRVEQLKRFWIQDNLKLCSKEHRAIMAWIANYLCEYEIITPTERDELYRYLGVEV
jgi:hypothetical protein